MQFATLLKVAPNGEGEIELAKTTVRFEIQDTGTGIPLEIKTRSFKSFSEFLAAQPGPQVWDCRLPKRSSKRTVEKSEWRANQELEDD